MSCPLQVREHHSSDGNERWIAAGQCLSCNLTAPEKYEFHLQPVLAEDSRIFGHPELALPRADGRIADSDLLQRLSLSHARGKKLNDSDENYRGKQFHPAPSFASGVNFAGILCH
jgi:hypothetical protein